MDQSEQQITSNYPSLQPTMQLHHPNKKRHALTAKGIPKTLSKTSTMLPTTASSSQGASLLQSCRGRAG
ncbi:hypothetical protein GYH30_051144 [Glycine max]|nr:hypothetical protein GYH30_051144 [Glycine max]